MGFFRCGICEDLVDDMRLFGDDMRLVHEDSYKHRKRVEIAAMNARGWRSDWYGLKSLHTSQSFCALLDRLDERGMIRTFDVDLDFCVEPAMLYGPLWLLRLLELYGGNSDYTSDFFARAVAIQANAELIAAFEVAWNTGGVNTTACIEMLWKAAVTK